MYKIYVIETYEPILYKTDKLQILKYENNPIAPQKISLQKKKVGNCLINIL